MEEYHAGVMLRHFFGPKIYDNVTSMVVGPYVPRHYRSYLQLSIVCHSNSWCEENTITCNEVNTIKTTFFKLLA